MLQRIPLAELLRVAALSLVTFVALGLSWQLASAAAVTRGTTAVAARAIPAARAIARSSRYGDTAAGGRATEAGAFLSLAGGVPLVVVDGGVSLALRVPRGATVLEALDLAGVALGALDRVQAREDGTTAPGDIIKVVRVAESQTVLREAVAFPIETVDDAGIAAGKVVVVTPGTPGVADNTYLVRTADGVEAERVLLSSAAVTAPVPEVRHVGTFRPPPPAGGDIAAIIRAAAATWGADPAQLLRVAYCESHYNPSAYNASSGASGLFQFLPRTWSANSVRAGYGGASVFDPVANANTAAYMFAAGQAGQWSCK